MLGPVIGVLFDGFAYGMLLFLLSVGLSVTLGMMNFVNLAHCAFAMLGGYVTVTLMNGLHWPFFATLPFALSLADKGWRRALADSEHLRHGLNVCAGKITHPAVAQDLGYEPATFEQVAA